jgi:hypothetical protein
VIKFHCFSPWELACLSILPFFEDLQVIPKKEGTLFPLRATRSFSEDMLGKRDLRFALLASLSRHLRKTGDFLAEY